MAQNSSSCLSSSTGRDLPVPPYPSFSHRSSWSVIRLWLCDSCVVFLFTGWLEQAVLADHAVQWRGMDHHCYYISLHSSLLLLLLPSSPTTSSAATLVYCIWLMSSSLTRLIVSRSARTVCLRLFLTCLLQLREGSVWKMRCLYLEQRLLEHHSQFLWDLIKSLIGQSSIGRVSQRLQGYGGVAFCSFR